MRVLLKDRLLILAPESAVERAALADWKKQSADCVFAPQSTTGAGFALSNLGLRVDVCREPINVTSRHPDPAIRLISNFAETPFELDGRHYRTVEGFWQSLRWETVVDREMVAQLTGMQAKKLSQTRPFGSTTVYEGETLPVGTWRHWELMERASRAKFEQNADARDALLATGERPLVHRMRKDSRSIPGIVMAEIWMKVRGELRR